MKSKFSSLVLAALVLLSLAATLPLSASATEDSADLMVVEWHGYGRTVVYQTLSEDNSMNNSHYALLPFHWHTTIKYWINPNNKYGFNASSVVTAITTAAETWDNNTSFELFVYQGTIRRGAGKRDGYNVIAWGLYSNQQAIAVTYIWYKNDTIIETDTIMNTRFKWSLNGEAGKMDVQNIMTHEFGHWCGLDDLYADEDYWLTMYGYAGYGETYKQTLGLGDILGLQALYGE
ncbi:MAG: hypothetical protein QXI91_05135 [Candidatus Bathyarchaeia archaeon]